ncbi:probable protein phosphatase 2C 72 [Gastrolobium bilobum]|uniref:probable protein phosphatase 2C 72 n=1 Tax=Gastrolobium bilobum TaxID=150636 RepID=UPI002AB11259|nr:probable protein phosphatase 2C 72 [Gastrolobium bilobum]
MGICISTESSAIHGAPEPEEGRDENVIIFESSNVLCETPRLCSVYSKQGSKGLNQDAATFLQGFGTKDAAYCGVFDGHGRNGHIVSKIVSKRVFSLILNQKDAHSKIDDALEKGDENILNHVDKVEDDKGPNKNIQEWEEAILSAFRVMDKEVKLQENIDCSCSGTTAVVVIREGEDLVIANLGDSRAILGTVSDDEIIPIQLTTDMKPGLPREADRIRSCNGRVFALKEESHIQRVWLPNENSPGLAMSRAFGDFMLKDHGIIAIPDISYRSLTSSDQFIVLASDGVWDVLSNNEVSSIVWTADTEKEAAKAVVEAATATWKNKYPFSKVDDCTVVCLFLQKKRNKTLYT